MRFKMRGGKTLFLLVWGVFIRDKTGLTNLYFVNWLVS